MKNLMKATALMAMCLASTEAWAKTPKFLKSDPTILAALPTDATPGSPIRYDMSEWDQFLRDGVLVTGRSDRTWAGTKNQLTNTKIKRTAESPSRLEGNRVLLHMIKAPQKEYLGSVVDQLEAFPSVGALERLSDNEQLAYWLNLRNAAMMEAIADSYPITYTKRLLTGSNSVLQQKRVRVLGMDLSIADMEAYIKQRFPSPLVMYGFYYGKVGGANVRQYAYTGENVREMLQENAVEFVNSLRGARFNMPRKYRTVNVSVLYDWHMDLFDNDPDKVLRHIQDYAEDRFAEKVAVSKKIKTNVDDWYIADLVNGHLNCPVTLLTCDSNGLPTWGNQFLFAVYEKNRRYYKDRVGRVEVEEYVETDLPATPRGTTASPTLDGAESPDESGQ